MSEKKENVSFSEFGSMFSKTGVIFLTLIITVLLKFLSKYIPCINCIVVYATILCIGVFVVNSIAIKESIELKCVNKDGSTCPTSANTLQIAKYALLSTMIFLTIYIIFPMLIIPNPDVSEIVPLINTLLPVFFAGLITTITNNTLEKIVLKQICGSENIRCNRCINSNIE